jgi:DNA-binding beta-propeller fold protein YncE
MAIKAFTSMLQNLYTDTISDLATYAGCQLGYRARVGSVRRDYVAVPVGTTSWTAGSNITVGTGPTQVTITPDGLRALIISYGSNNVTPLTYSGGVWTAGSNITVGTSPNGSTITPDGLRALVANQGSANVTPLTYSGGIWTAGSPISVGTDPGVPIITSDGLRALVVNIGSNTVIPLTYSGSTWTAGSPITVGTHPNWVAITPDGLRALVTNSNSNTITPLTYSGSTWTAGSPITVGTSPVIVTITPDGLRALVTNSNSNTVTPLAYSGSTWTAGSPITVGTSPDDVTITPDGLRALVANSGSANVTPLTYSGGVWIAGSPIIVGTTSEVVIITPDGIRALAGGGVSNTVTSLTYSSGVWTAGTPITVGTVPEIFAITPDGLHALIPNSGSGTVTPLTFPDPVVYLPGTGVDWQYIQGTSDTKWLSQATWYIDPIAGNNENSGIDSGHPIKDCDEIQRRWGNNAIIPQAVTINVLNNIDHIFLKAIPYDNTCKLTVKGTVTPILTTTISAFANYSHGTYGSVDPTPTILSGTGISDWTPYIGKRLRSNSLYAWTDIVNPNGGGVSTVSSSPWGFKATTLVFTQSSPSVSDPLIIESLSTVGYIDITWIGGDGYGDTPSFGSFNDFIEIQNFDIINKLSVAVTSRDSCISIFGCNIRITAYIANINSVNFIIYICYILNNIASNQLSFQGCLLTNTFGYLSNFYYYCLSRNNGSLSSYNFWGDSIISSTGSLLSVQAFNSYSSLIYCQLSTIKIKIFGMSGKAAAGAVGIFLANGCSILFDSTVAYNILGGSGAAEIGTATNATIGVNGWKWSDCINGFRLGHWNGTGTLTGGVLPITLSPALTTYFPAGSRIRIGYITPKSGAGQIGYDTLTTSGFRINNGDSNDNTSVVWWEADSAIPRTNEVIPANLT